MRRRRFLKAFGAMLLTPSIVVSADAGPNGPRGTLGPSCPPGMPGPPGPSEYVSMDNLLAEVKEWRDAVEALNKHTRRMVREPSPFFKHAVTIR